MSSEKGCLILYATTGGFVLSLITMFGCCAAYGRRTERRLAYAAQLQNDVSDTLESAILSSDTVAGTRYDEMPNQLSDDLGPDEVEIEPVQLTDQQKAEEEAYRKLIAGYASEN